MSEKYRKDVIPMKWTGLNEIREKYLSFFESKGHLRLNSFPLIPRDDNSLLLINSGMAPMKKYFTGQVTPPRTRVTTCQKCIRTPDIESVGKTSRHGTYFEMLGNFSFGDYFKKDAIPWAWEFLTKVMEIPAEKLYATIYPKDDEAFHYWTDEVGMAPSHIVRLEDNFWEIGSGPCGPDSEIFYDRGEKYGCGKPTCGPGCDCDRYIEIWNLVFTQFNSDGEGNYSPLEHPNIDTGMGLERLACIMQDVDNLFEVDTIQNIMKHVSQIAGVTYKKDEKNDISLRVITDHIRSTTFMIGDGVVPQNEGRGYVLKRLLRRAARHGRLLGIQEPFLYKVCETVIRENASAYPELTEKKEYIVKMIQVEEERFARTIDQGMETLSGLLDKLEAEGKKVLDGGEAFRLYDTFGFPIDLTSEIAEERGISVDMEEFQKCMQKQRETARSNAADLGSVGWAEDVLAEFANVENHFSGYEKLEDKAEILAIVKDAQLVDNISDGDNAAIILTQTPFYAEMGGQIGDQGVLKMGETVFHVTDCKKSQTGLFMHVGHMTAGMLSKGDAVDALVDKKRRHAIMRNHTASHLLQSALRAVLGTHVHQAGSYVDSERLRFDFSHFSAMTREELEKVEAMVNELILDAYDVTVQEMPLEEAKKLGAMALFGEKYGDVVRVVKVEDKSVEFCGGTHVKNTAHIGLFRIVSESSVASGVRRIEGVTGSGVLALLDHKDALLGSIAENLKSGNVEELPARSAAVMADMKAKDREIDTLNSRIANANVESLLSSAVEIKGLSVAAVRVNNMKPDTLRMMGDRIKESSSKVIAVLGGVNEEKGNILVVCGADAVKAGAHAGKIVKLVSGLTGASGGGRPDSAMGGVGDIAKLDQAIEKAPQVVEDFLK